MKNFLQKIESNEVNFFVSKSYLTVLFDYDRQKPEYHIYYIKKNSSPDAYHQGYTNLKMKKMNRKELAYFLSNKEAYTEVISSDDGSIFNLKSKPFDKSLCPTHKQLMLSL